MLLSSLFLLLACGGDTPKDTSPADTGDTVDTGATDDTSTPDTSGGDTSDTSGGDTGDTAKVEPLPACDTLTPYRGCTAVSGYDNPIYPVDEIVWDAAGRVTRSDTYTDASRTVLVYSLAYTYTDGLLTRLEYLDAAGEVYATTTYSYDAAGNLTEVYDGQYSTRYTYTYDAEGRMLTSTTETRTRLIFCDRMWTSTATGADYEESCEGYRYTGSVDTRMLETLRVFYDITSGDELQLKYRVFRTDCQPLSVTDETNVGGVVSRLQYTYDANGRLSEEATDYLTGDPVLRTTRTYTCPE